MQMNPSMVQRYREKAPELLDAVSSGEAEYVMRRDEQSGFCVKYDNGWCGIHKDYGETYLGDACHFFPRITRRLGEHTLMSASLSCPEVARLALAEGAGQGFQEAAISRVPESLRDYAPEALGGDQALQVHRFFIQAASDDSLSAARIMARLRSVAASLESIDVASWAAAAPFYWNNADSRLPVPEANINDPFNLLNALQGLLGASSLKVRDRLMRVIQLMEQALCVSLDWQALSIATSAASLPAWQHMEQSWQQHYAPQYDEALRRWIEAELSAMCFPFAGFGDTLTHRAALLGVRFATLRLALMSACHVAGEAVGEGEVIEMTQALARFMGHLADPTLSLQIYAETGWLRESRLRAIAGDS